MKREMFESGGAQQLLNVDRKDPNDKDPGLLEEKGIIVDRHFDMFSSNPVSVRTKAVIPDTAYNQFRQLFKDANTL